MQKVMTVGTTKLRKKSAVMKVGKRSTEKLIELLRTSQGEARAELVRKILRSVLLLGDRVCVDECAQGKAALTVVREAVVLKQLINRLGTQSLRTCLAVKCSDIASMNVRKFGKKRVGMPRKITNPDNDLSKFLPFFDSVFFHLSNCTQITKQIEIKEFKDSASKKDYIWALTCKYGGKCETTKRADAAADARAALGWTDTSDRERADECGSGIK